MNQSNPGYLSRLTPTPPGEASWDPFSDDEA